MNFGWFFSFLLHTIFFTFLACFILFIVLAIIFVARAPFVVAVACSRAFLIFFLFKRRFPLTVGNFSCELQSFSSFISSFFFLFLHSFEREASFSVWWLYAWCHFFVSFFTCFAVVILLCTRWCMCDVRHTSVTIKKIQKLIPVTQSNYQAAKVENKRMLSRTQYWLTQTDIFSKKWNE